MARLHLGKRIAPPRFVLFAAVLVAGLAALIPTVGLGRGVMAAFDIAAFVTLLAWTTLFRRGEADQIRRAAEENDANRTALLTLTGLIMVVILVAVHGELKGKNDTLAIALVLTTLVLSWLFSNLVYALHYAHVYYSNGSDGGDRGGLQFPGCDEPDYWDFVYFSFTLGMCFQTSDVTVCSRKMRRVALGHTVAAFVFNLGVLAFTINSLGGGS